MLYTSKTVKEYENFLSISFFYLIKNLFFLLFLLLFSFATLLLYFVINLVFTSRKKFPKHIKKHFVNSRINEKINLITGLNGCRRLDAEGKKEEFEYLQVLPNNIYKFI